MKHLIQLQYRGRRNSINKILRLLDASMAKNLQEFPKGSRLLTAEFNWDQHGWFLIPRAPSIQTFLVLQDITNTPA